MISTYWGHCVVPYVAKCMAMIYQDSGRDGHHTFEVVL